MRLRLALLAFLSAAPAFPQGFEAALVGGYTTPGDIEKKAPGIETLELAGSFTWGASVTRFFSPRLGVEASWTRVGSELVIGTSAGSTEFFDVNIDRLQGSLMYRFGGEQARVRPFVSAGVGATFFGAPGLDGETKLGLGLGAGATWMPSRRWGARLAARYEPTRLNDADAEFCDPFGFCQGWLNQLELAAGVVFRF